MSKSCQRLASNQIISTTNKTITTKLIETTTIKAEPTPSFENSLLEILKNSFN